MKKTSVAGTQADQYSISQQEVTSLGKAMASDFRRGQSHCSLSQPVSRNQVLVSKPWPQCVRALPPAGTTSFSLRLFIACLGGDLGLERSYDLSLDVHHEGRAGVSRSWGVGLPG